MQVPVCRGTTRACLCRQAITQSKQLLMLSVDLGAIYLQAVMPFKRKRRSSPVLIPLL